MVSTAQRKRTRSLSNNRFTNWFIGEPIDTKSSEPKRRTVSGLRNFVGNNKKMVIAVSVLLLVFIVRAIFI